MPPTNSTKQQNLTSSEQQGIERRNIFHRHSVLILLLLLVLTLSAFALYNYTSQRQVFLKQLQTDTDNIVAAVRSSIVKFQAAEATMGLQELVQNISLNLEIFEFRYLAPDGTVINSMFKDEIGHKFDHPSLKLSTVGLHSREHIYLDVRDYTSVMAISHPVYFDGKMVGIIDLALDISEYDKSSEAARSEALRHMRTGIRNLISAIEGSITNSLTVFRTVDIYQFLNSYVQSSRNILQVAILASDGAIEVSSQQQLVGASIDVIAPADHDRLIVVGGQPLYQVTTPLTASGSSGRYLYLLIDATPFAANERKLLMTALGTSSLAIVFSILITYVIYRINNERTRQENIRLEKTVRARTAEIENLSRTDPLTGLFNRRHLEEVTEAEFRRAVRYDHDLALMIIDLDHFKQLNDTYGHLGGDAVLRGIGQLLQVVIRETDVAGRFGGEEFVVVLPETGRNAAAKVAEDLRTSIENMPIDFHGRCISVTSSIGISVLRDDHREVKTLLNEADTALYRSKQDGRNRVTFFAPDNVPTETVRVNAGT